MALLLCLTGWDPAPWIDRLNRLAPGIDIRLWPDVGSLGDIDYAAVWRPPEGSLARLPSLKGILSLGAGVDHIFSDPTLPDVPIGRVIDSDLTARMSEWVTLHALTHLRRQRLYDAFQRRRLWRDLRPAPAARELRVGIMGLGVLGQDAARKLSLLGFDVAGWSRTPKSIEGLKTYASPELDIFLARTDLLVALLPLTQDTKGILDRRLFAKLARDGVFGAPALMNAGRGGLQVEGDILAALDSGLLASAMLDVFETEPLPAECPLWTHPAVTITPHNSAPSDPDAVGRFILRQIDRHRAGQPFEALVERDRGY